MGSVERDGHVVRIGHEVDRGVVVVLSDAHLGEEARDALGVVLVHLAPEGAHEVSAGLGGGLAHGRPVYERPGAGTLA